MYKLLVIDDEQYALEGIMKTVDWDSLGITSVYGADCVKDAKEIIQNHVPEIIICDIEMAEESGLDLLHWLHDSRYRYRLLFLTAYPNFTYAQEAIKLGAFEYLLKPVEHGILKEGVRRALEDYQSESLLHNRLEEYEMFLQEWEALGRGSIKADGEETKDKEINENEGLIREVNEPELIYLVKKYINDNIGLEITRDSIAEAVGVNASYLSRIFHKATREKLSSYILQKRIKQAKKLLKETDDKITVIADQIGYGNDSYFIKIFKNITNMTPNEYRKKARQSVGDRYEQADGGKDESRDESKNKP